MWLKCHVCIYIYETWRKWWSNQQAMKLLHLEDCIIHTGGGQNNGNTKKLRNRFCFGYTERSSVGSTMFFRLFTLCSARVSALMTVLIDNPCELENGRLVRFWRRTNHWCTFSLSICDQKCHINHYVYQEQQFLRLCWHTRIVGRQHQHWHKEIVVHWEGLFWKITELLQHRWQDSRSEYSSWRPCFHRNCPTWTSQIQHPQ
jgi:hypothetical protein